MSDLCRGGKLGEATCDCEEFSPSENPKRCMECDHGESKHGPPQSQNLPPPVPTPASTSLTDIFGNLSGTVPRSTPLPTGAVSQMTARTEALQTKMATGFSRMSQLAKSKRVLSTSKASTSTDRKVSIFWSASFYE